VAASFREHIWRHFRVALPAEWEQLGYALAMNQGRCAFADRYQYRLEVTWRVVPGPPDFARILDGYTAHLRKADAEVALTPITRSGWEGLAVASTAEPSTRLGRYFPGERCLVELVVLWPEGRDVALEGRILQGIADVPADAQGLRRWRAYGLDLRVAEGMSLQSCRVEPANVRLQFGAGAERQATFVRVGLLDYWLRGTPAAWLRTQLPAGARVQTEATEQRGSHAVIALTGTLTTPRWLTLVGRRPQLQAWGWRCPTDGRLYAEIRVTPSRTPPAPCRLTCCAGGEGPR
jgi:hypothetical protein